MVVSRSDESERLRHNYLERVARLRGAEDAKAVPALEKASRVFRLNDWDCAKGGCVYTDSDRCIVCKKLRGLNE